MRKTAGPADTRRADIERCRPRLAASITRLLERIEDDEPVTEIVPTRTGDNTQRLNGRLAHSSIAPRPEAERLVTHALANDPDAVVVFGSGLGYHLEALRRQAPSLPVILIECSRFLLEEILVFRSGPWWCENGPDIVLAPEEEDRLTTELNAYGVYRPALLALQAVSRSYPEEVINVGSVLERYRHRRTVNRNTLRRFGKLWVRNTLKNLERSAVLPGIGTLVDLVPGVPALVCGAGPTLEDLLPVLPKLKNRCLVIAVDTAVTVMQRAGIAPHLAIIADPQYWNTRHLDPVRFAPDRRFETVLVAEPATHPRVFRIWRGSCLLSASLFPLGAFIDSHKGYNRKLGAGGSVATSAWDLARLMGSREIYLGGIDLGFPNRRTHCGGTFFEERLVLNASRLKPAEQSLFRYLNDADPRPVPAAGGGTILSDRRMVVYRSWFADQRRLYPEVTTYLLSPHSSAIDGVEPRDPTELISSLSPVTIPPMPVPPAPSHTTDSIRDDLIRSVEAIMTLAEDGLEICRKLESRTVVKPEDLTSLDTLDRRLAQCEEREIAGFLAGEALEQATGMTVRNTRDAVEQARRLYSALRESCRVHQDLLARYR